MRSELLRRGETVAARYEAITVCCESALWVGFSCLHLQNPPLKGRVYDIRKPSVLLKVVRPELVREPGTCDRLMRELQRIQALKRRGLMPLVDVQFLEMQRTVVLIDSCVSVPTRRVHGMHTMVGTEIFLLKETHRAMLRLAAVLGDLHRRGLCHGDLRPETVLLEMGQLFVSLRDLGLGTSLPRADYLQALKYRGDLELVAPEVRDGRAPDPRADVFGVATLYQSVLESACEQEHTTPQRKYPALAQVLKRGLHDDPAQRYESGAALRSALAGVAPR